MELTRYDDVHAFYAEAGAYLLADEAQHNLAIGICLRLMEQPEYSSLPPYFGLVFEKGAIVAAALMTPPHNLILMLGPAPAALSLIADDVRNFRAPPGVIGPQQESLTFARIWQTKTGQTYRLRTAERIYQLEQVIPPHPASGHLRQATSADRALLIDWFEAFGIEAMGEGDRAASERNVDLRLRMPAIGSYLWEDEQPVSFTGAYRATPNGARIGPVYTPPDARGHGYASTCVAAVSQLLLDEGRKFCFLFTNLSNPTSNHIYQQIGYQPVADVDDYVFDS